MVQAKLPILNDVGLNALEPGLTRETVLLSVKGIPMLTSAPFGATSAAQEAVTLPVMVPPVLERSWKFHTLLGVVGMYCWLYI